jgi:hypothetical protein
MTTVNWWCCLPVDECGQCDEEERATVFDDGWKRRRMRSNVNADDTSLAWVFLFKRPFMTCGFLSHLPPRERASQTLESNSLLFRCKKGDLTLPCPNRMDHRCISANSGGVYKFEGNNEAYSAIVFNQNQENGLELGNIFNTYLTHGHKWHRVWHRGDTRGQACQMNNKKVNECKILN